jgi:predicted dehydrogenase
MPLKVALVGAGHMGRIHLEKLSASPDVEIAGVVDIRPDLAQDMSTRYGVPHFTSYNDVPVEMNGVVIATPTETHYEIAQAFLDRGIHVFMEKPITLTPGEGQNLIDLAQKKGLVFQIGHLERFNPAFRRAVALVKQPVFIEAVRVGPFTGRSTDVDVVHDLMIHDLDLTLTLTKGKVKGIESRGVSLVSDKLDMVSTRIEFTDGCVASLTASRMATRRERNLSVYEKGGYFFIDLLKGKLTATTKTGEGEIVTKEYPTENPDPVMDEITEFLQSMRGLKTPTVSGQDGLNALVLADGITDAIAEHLSA